MCPLTICLRSTVLFTLLLCTLNLYYCADYVDNNYIQFNVDAVYYSNVGNHAPFVSHDVVNFIFSVSIRASPCPSHPCSLLKLCVHDLEII